MEDGITMIIQLITKITYGKELIIIIKDKKALRNQENIGRVI